MTHVKITQSIIDAIKEAKKYGYSDTEIINSMLEFDGIDKFPKTFNGCHYEGNIMDFINSIRG